ncbi:MAG: transporter substrate-binding domain-containing protein [Candidatus Azobacteroides sp.]|nr:transporter substrate-binding domain-containing protein [Candidatus Azobacteroides sp.]
MKKDSYKQITIYAALLLIVVLLILLLKEYGNRDNKVGNAVIGDPGDRDYTEIKEDGVLRVVTEYNTMGYFVSGDTISGFQYDLAKLFGKKMGLQVEIYPEMDLKKSIDGLIRGDYDVIARNIPVTSELRKELNFTQPIMLNKQVLVQRTAKYNNGIQPIRNQLGLAGKTLYIPENSPSLLRIHNLSVEIGDTVQVKEMEKYESEQLIIMVAKGDIDYAVCDEAIAQKNKSRFPEIDIETDISFTQLQAWAVRKNSPELLDSLNAWIEQLKINNEIDKIQRQYIK